MTDEAAVLSPMDGGAHADPAPADPSPAVGYAVYLVRCADGSLYGGIARDVTRRLAEHNGRPAVAGETSPRGRGARYTAGRRPVTLVYQCMCATRSDAQREEARIKRLSRSAKERLVALFATQAAVAD